VLDTRGDSGVPTLRGRLLHPHRGASSQPPLSSLQTAALASGGM